MDRNIIKIAIGVGAGIIAIASRKKIKGAAGKVKKTVGGALSKPDDDEIEEPWASDYDPILPSAPDYSKKRAPHLIIDDLDKIEDYVYLKSDMEYVIHLSKRVEHDLRYILDLNENDRTTLGELLLRAVDCNVFGDDMNLYNSINQFRKARNKIVHGEGTKITFKYRLKWALAAFKLEDLDESDTVDFEDEDLVEDDDDDW